MQQQAAASAPIDLISIFLIQLWSAQPIVPGGGDGDQEVGGAPQPTCWNPIQNNKTQPALRIMSAIKLWHKYFNQYFFVLLSQNALHY